jgi:hypothetical protein
MITTLSIISLDQGKIWREPADEDARASIAPAAAEAVEARRRVWGWIRQLLSVRRPAA